MKIANNEKRNIWLQKSTSQLQLKDPQTSVHILKKIQFNFNSIQLITSKLITPKLKEIAFNRTKNKLKFGQ